MPLSALLHPPLTITLNFKSPNSFNHPQLFNSIQFPVMNEPCVLGTPKRREAGEVEQRCYSMPNITNNKRKSPGKRVTPRKRSSKNSTPKKNESDFISPCSAQKFDLRLEAKLSAEEDSRMFAGRKIHPFFSLWKVEKKIQQPVDSEHGLSTAKREDGRISCGPIHVFENVKDDSSPLDWKDWTFLGKTSTTDFDPKSSNSYALEGSVESLNFDNFLSAFKPSSASISQNALSYSDQLSIQPDNIMDISPAFSTVLANEQTICPLKTEDAKLDLEVGEASTSGQKGIFSKSETELLCRFLQESTRSYYHSCKVKAESSLWIHKYKPTKAIEVCGNDESVNFLRDWLQLWHEKHHGRKDSSNRAQSDMQDGDGYNCSDSDSALDDFNEEDSRQNILLIAGPVGSGKSAAVYACAQEQGFEVLELNASDCRNGAAVKQYFGDALGSHQCKRLLDKKVVKFPLSSALPNGKAAGEIDDGMIDLISISSDEAQSPSRTSLLHRKTLILVEDVDILFPEDRGCIAAIQHIARTAKGPIILTSNSKNGGLPDNFAKLHVAFTLPLPEVLLCHLYMICVTEEVNISPLLLEKFMQSCDGDIRKTIMQLQFWLQSEKYRKERKAQAQYGSLPFDLEACHQIIPKILPWNFPSELSKLIEKEVAKLITIMQENSCLQGLVNRELDTNERKNDLDGRQYVGTDFIESKGESIKSNISCTDCNEFESQYSAISDLSNCSGALVTASWQNGQRKLVMISSDSEDKNPNNGHSLSIHDEAYKRPFLEGNSESPCKFPLNQSYTSSSICQVVCPGLECSEEEQCKYLETAYDACLNETHKSFDISCFPGSISVPETTIQNGIGTKSGLTSGCLACPVEVSLNNDLTAVTYGISQCLAKLPQNSAPLVSAEIPESPKAVAQDFRDEKMETSTICNVIGECNLAFYKSKSKVVDSCPPMETNVVENLWKKLCVCQTDLRQHTYSEQLGAIHVAQLSSGLTNLISEADYLFHNHQQKQCGILEPPMSLSDEDTFSWYDEQLMMSTLAVHGFCLYAKHISGVASKLGCENTVDVTSEMLASTTNIMALGKLSRQDQTKGMSFYTKNQTNDTKRTSLFNVIQSIVPARSSLATRGLAFNEYLSSLRQISVSEGFRISQGVGKLRKRRTRGAQHYLSGGTMMSLEDISLLCEGDLYRMISSQYTGNMESNCT
ncbi:hypothetical protein RJT34_12215 [Clitoria ternatea]|uniref:ATPase AAA-type core domain-containing protein n=1 Tax=Clitoria ternatea TaxID=43366 RepID=A0AAN9PL61_CLITE